MPHIHRDTYIEVLSTISIFCSLSSPIRLLIHSLDSLKLPYNILSKHKRLRTTFSQTRICCVAHFFLCFYSVACRFFFLVQFSWNFRFRLYSFSLRFLVCVSHLHLSQRRVDYVEKYYFAGSIKSNHSVRQNSFGVTLASDNPEIVHMDKDRNIYAHPLERETGWERKREKTNQSANVNHSFYIYILSLDVCLFIFGCCRSAAAIEGSVQALQ